MPTKGKKTKTSKSARRGMSQAIRHHMKDEHMPQDQAVAVAYSEQRKRGRRVPKRRKGTGRTKSDHRKASAASRRAGRKSRGGKRKGQTARSRAAQKAGRASARARARKS